MISFDLECSNGHCFEGWFNDNDSFNAQKNRGLVSCPYCDDRDITKLISTFTTRRASSHKANSGLESIASKFIKYVDSNFDNVGTDFASETLKMHYGVVERRNIRGVSSPEEEKIMESEGIKFLKIPLFYGKYDLS